METIQYKKLEVMQPRIKNDAELLVNKPSGISPHDVLQSWLIKTDYHWLVNNNNDDHDNNNNNNNNK